jgi:hypothetical protein
MAASASPLTALSHCGSSHPDTQRSDVRSVPISSGPKSLAHRLRHHINGGMLDSGLPLVESLFDVRGASSGHCASVDDLIRRDRQERVCIGCTPGVAR